MVNEFIITYERVDKNGIIGYRVYDSMVRSIGLLVPTTDSGDGCEIQVYSHFYGIYGDRVELRKNGINFSYKSILSKLTTCKKVVIDTD